MARGIGSEAFPKEMTRSTLATHPAARIHTMEELIGVAMAIETEAATRYRQLSVAMAARGEEQTARIFSDMATHEEGHILAVQDLATRYACADLRPELFVWRLPAELSTSWDEVSGSALLTAYRALSIAVENEQRAFSFYAFIAAETKDSHLARVAETLAREEMGHAAELRKWRRAAYHRTPPASRAQQMPLPETMAAFTEATTAAEGRIAACHAALAGQMAESGAADLASALHGLAEQASRHAGAMSGSDPGIPGDYRTAPPLAVLLAAQKPLESLSEYLERVVLEAPSDELRIQATAHLEDVLRRIATINRLSEAATLMSGGIGPA